MKAMVCTKYGPPDVLQLQDIDKPVPKDNEVLIRIHATSVTAGDYRIRGLNVPFGFKTPMRLMLGFNKPRQSILGINLAGVIEAVGKDVKQFKVTDAVYGSSGMKLGCYAEYICLDENSSLTTKPEHISFEAAAAFPFGMFTALSFLRDKGRIQPGEKVLIYGASGAVGTAAIQLAKYFGAEVTAVCSGENIELVASLGADKVIDYTKQDFTQSGEQYDIIFDTVGKSSFSGSLNSLRDNGRYLLTVTDLWSNLRILWSNLFRHNKVIAGIATENRDDLLFLAGLFESGKITPVVDRIYPFAQLPDAHAYAEQGHKKGNVVITMSDQP
ncbi:MAG: NAD(P)-dependent alcohol dehydrogenase [Gammaproteobacteria bacterium]|nr:NAD(P)-dependent alcohol dehydrogenase [Gammaproteobacteria bacterium]MDH5653708.1 NAD(P)-dependent alcohol dehydrogenase [Gammaproteobacteria bacterium]